MSKGIYKCAGGGLDAVMASMGPLGGIGHTIGLLKTKPSKYEVEDYNNSGILSLLVPGVGGYRFAQRQKAAGATSNRILMDAAGSNLAVPLLLAAVGATTGGLIGRDAESATIGALSGFGTGSIASIMGTLVGAAKRKRTEQEQKAAERNHSNLLAMTVPGYGSYQMARRAKSTND